MLPCPYFLEGDCKFSDEKCRFSHGDLVLFKNLQEYTEPDFSSLSIGSTVLTKQADKLWHKGTVKRILKDKCSVVLDSSAKDVEVDLHDVLPLENDEESSSSSSEEDAEENGEVINMSLMNAPSGLALGEWEKHTKVLIILFIKMPDTTSAFVLGNRFEINGKDGIRNRNRLR